MTIQDHQNWPFSPSVCALVSSVDACLMVVEIELIYALCDSRKVRADRAAGGIFMFPENLISLLEQNVKSISYIYVGSKLFDQSFF